MQAETTTARFARARPLLDVFDKNTRAWGVSLKQGAVIFALPLVATLLVFGTGAWFALFDFLTRENSVFEWLQVLLLVAAATLLVSVARTELRGRRRLVATAYLLAALAVVFVAGEELSWGQSLLDWRTPEAFSDRNFQDETNVHNITNAHAPFVYAVMLVALYGAVAPFAAASRADRLGPLGGLLFPPLCLVPAFLVAFVYRATRLFVAPEDHLPRYTFQIVELSELAELSLYFGVFMVSLLAWRRWASPRQRQPPRRGSRRKRRGRRRPQAGRRFPGRSRSR